MKITRAALEQRAATWLKQGISPPQLALTLALGFTIGCLPVVGITTITCAVVALTLGLNLPVIQAANYAAMPFQLILIVPFLRLGGRIVALGGWSEVNAGAIPMLPDSPALKLALHVGSMAVVAMLGWLLVAVPAVVVMTVGLNAALKRVPALTSQGK